MKFIQMLPCDDGVIVLTSVDGEQESVALMSWDEFKSLKWAFDAAEKAR